MNLQNIIVCLCVLLFIVYYTLKNYNKKDIILRLVLVLFFGWYSINMQYNKYYNHYYEIYIFSFFCLFFLIPLTISILINIFLKFDLLYVFTVVFMIQWVIFLNVNPCTLKYDSKYSVMEAFPKKFIPKQQYLLSEINIENIHFPVIIKPNICSSNALGIYIIHNKKEYIDILHNKKININDYMVQELLEDYNIELKILYEKYPWNKEGKIINIFMVPTNKFNIKLEEYWYNMFSKKKNMSSLITPKLNRIFEKLMNKIPNYYVGRFDVLVKNVEDLNNLKFKIVELNGTMGIDFRYNDYTTFFNYKFLYDLIINFQWYYKRIIIGLYNIFTLNGYNPISLIIVMFITFRDMIKCNYWENLFSLSL